MKKTGFIKYYIILILNCCTISILYAQNVTVSGRITNAETGNPVEFANIGVENTYLGTASDLNGNFELTLSNAIKDKVIRVSAVGYQTKSFSVEKWLKEDFIYIQLAPASYGIGEISIEARSQKGYGIIKTTTNLIAENYIQSPYTYKCYIRSFYQPASNRDQVKTESVFLMSDSKGYTNRSFTDAYENRNYKIIENNVADTPVGFKDGLTMIDNLINMDIVRCPGNVLTVASMHDYKIEMNQEGVYEGDSVWVLDYKCNNPNIVNCGDPEAEAVEGTIWISKNNNVILKNKVNVIRKGYFQHGNSFFNPINNQVVDKIEYVVETNYIKEEGLYRLGSVDYLQKTSGSEQYDYKIWLKVIEKETIDQSIKKRQYFNSIEKDNVFWQKFSLE